jgi:hypothetical protein
MAKKTIKKKEGKLSITDVASATAHANRLGAGLDADLPYYVTEDGQVFQDINNALNHATPNKLKYFICND